MLTRRLQTLLNVRERAKLVRYYFACNNVHSNLKSPINLSRDRCFSSIKNLIPVFNGREWLVDIEKRNGIFLRLCHTATSYNTTTEYSSENKYAHAILSMRGIKWISAFFGPIENVTDEEAERILNNDWEHSSPEEVLRAFESLSCHAKLNSISLDEEIHGGILRAVDNKLKQLDDDTFLRVFARLALWKGILSTRFPAYVLLIRELNRKCAARFQNWNSDEALLVCECWHQIGLMNQSTFPKKVLTKLGAKPSQLTAEQFLLFMFMLSVCRKPPINMYEIEYRFSSIFDEFTANELGVVAMGFFKTKTPFRDENILVKMHRKILEDLDSIHEISIGAIMKMTRYSINLKAYKTLTELLQALTSRVGGFSIPSLTSIVHAAAFVQYFEPELMSAVIENFEKNIDKARIKDIERFSWALSIFDYNPEAQVYKKIIASLRDPKRKAEMERFPMVPAVALSHLSITGIFPMDLIETHFNPHVLRQSYNSNPYKIGYNFFTLETNLRVDMPEYEGPFLEPIIRDFYAKKFLCSRIKMSGKVHPSDKFILEVAHVCKLVLKSETSIDINQVLPHYMKPDIIVCFDETNNPIDPQPILSKITTDTIKHAPQIEKNLKWIAIVLATQNQIIRGTSRFIGPLKCKIRQLEKIGYNPVVVSYTDWHGLAHFTAKQDYIRNKLSLSTNHSLSAVVL